MNTLKALRAERGLTIQQLAKETGLDPATISKLENDHTKAQAVTLGKLAKFFNLPVTELAPLTSTTAVEGRGKASSSAKAKAPPGTGTAKAKLS